MNNLLKILISLFVVIGLNADQGMLNSRVPLINHTPSGNIIKDIVTDNNNVYAVIYNTVYKYDLDLGLIGTKTVGSSNNKVLVSNDKLFVLEDSNLYALSLDLNTSFPLVSPAKTFNSMALSDTSGAYVFVGTTTGVIVVEVATASEVAFISTTNAMDLIVKNDTLYVADDWGGIRVINIANPKLATLDSSISGTYYKLAIENDYLYTLGSTGLNAFDISSTAAPTILSTANILRETASSSSSLEVDDTYVYVGDGAGIEIFDVSNKRAMVNIVSESTSAISSIALSESPIDLTHVVSYSARGSTIEKHTAETDYPNILANGASSITKTVSQLDAETAGVFGELGSATDIDIIEFDLPSGRFKATITGMSNLNVSLYNSLTDVNTSTPPLISLHSSTNTIELNQEVVAGLRYLKIYSDINSTGEYKITAETGGDDWTDIMSSASVINMGETLSGNIIDSEDLDYFRVDVTSKGSLSFTSTNGDVLSIEVKNSYDDSNLTTTGTLSTTQYVELPSAGTYFIKAHAISTDVENADYSFRVDFSKAAALDKEDDAPFSLSYISELNALTDLNHIKIDGDYIYVVNGILSLDEINKNDFNLSINYAVGDTVIDYQIIGDYIYILSPSKLSIFEKGNGAVKSSISAFSTSEFFKVNANYAYVSEEYSTYVTMVDISDKASMSVESAIDVGSYVYGMDLKTSFIDGVLRTYLYLATQNGLKIYDFTDPQNITFVQSYKGDQRIMGVKISNPYAYISIDNNYDDLADEFAIIYVKRPESSPKFKGSINVDGITDIVINQDFAYLITNTNISDADDKYLKVVDISDQTNPQLIDTSIISGQNSYQYARDIVVEGGLGYIIEKSTTLYKMVKYDMSKDYSDIKNYAKIIDFNTKVYGTISEHRVDDNDTFYIDIKSTATLDFTTNGDMNTTYELYDFNNDTNVSFSFDSLPSTETNSTTDVKAGEYYIKVHSQAWSSSGSYEFTISKTDDDYSDEFSNAVLIDADSTHDATILISDDVDMVKIVLTERGTLNLTTTGTGIISSLYYDDAQTLVASDINSVLEQELNPGTYYIKIEGDGSFTGTYNFTTTFTQSDVFSMTDGFDDISNFKSKYVVYGPRYIYSVDIDNQLSVYNHLLQRVSKASISAERDLQQNCGEVFYGGQNVFINIAELDNGTGEYTCGHGYQYIDIGDGGDDYYAHSRYPNQEYFSGTFNSTVNDMVLIGADNNYLYEYSKENFQIYKIALSEINNGSYAKTPYAVLPTDINDTIDNFKSMKNDGNIDFIANNNVLTIYNTDPALDQYDNNTSPPTYLGTFPTVIETKSFTPLEGDVNDMYIDRDLKILYVLNENSTNIKLVDYSSGVISSTIGNIDVFEEPNGFYVKDDKVYISFSSYGMKVYSYPFSSTSTKIYDIPNIGADISKPFSYDGSTFNYLSSGNPQLYLLGDSFKDGKTAGTYSVIEDVKEGEGGFEGCFIATAAYGNYFTPNVKILRDFRDDYLLQNELGRAFVDLYYRYSPSIASNISESEFAKASVRAILTPIVYIIKYPLVFLTMFILFVLGIKMRKYFATRRVVIS